MDGNISYNHPIEQWSSIRKVNIAYSLPASPPARTPEILGSLYIDKSFLHSIQLAFWLTFENILLYVIWDFVTKWKMCNITTLLTIPWTTQKSLQLAVPCALSSSLTQARLPLICFGQQKGKLSVYACVCAALCCAARLQGHNDLHTFTHTFWQIVQVLCVCARARVPLSSTAS